MGNAREYRQFKRPSFFPAEEGGSRIVGRMLGLDLARCEPR